MGRGLSEHRIRLKALRALGNQGKIKVRVAEEKKRVATEKNHCTRPRKVPPCYGKGEWSSNITRAAIFLENTLFQQGVSYGNDYAMDLKGRKEGGTEEKLPKANLWRWGSRHVKLESIHKKKKKRREVDNVHPEPARPFLIRKGSLTEKGSLENLK